MMTLDLLGNKPKSIFESKTFWGAVFTALVSIIPRVWQTDRQTQSARANA